MKKSVFKNLIFRYILIALFFVAHQITLSHFHISSHHEKSCHTCEISKHFKHSKNNIFFTIVENIEITQNTIKATKPVVKKRSVFVSKPLRKPLHYHYRQTDIISKIPIGFNATAPPSYFS